MTEARPDRPLLDAARLEQLQAGLHAVRGGDFSVRLPGSADPLLDGIADAFNQLTDHLGDQDPAPSRYPPTLSHELRTPLNSVLVLARLLAQNPDGNLTPRQVEYADVIHSAGSDLLQVISDLTDPDTHGAPAPPPAMPAADSAGCRLLVAEATRGGLLTLLARGAVSDLAGPQDPVAVRTATTVDEVAEALADGRQGCVVLDMRAGDALAFGALGLVRSQARSRRVPVLAHGRSEEDKARFTRLRASPEAEPIELLELPAELRERIASHVSATAPASGRPGHVPLRGKKILVVDDDRRNVFAISSTLEHYGMDVISAGDGRAGIERLRGEPGTDLILMDLMMPGMDGYAAITAIRDIPEFSDLPIIAVTAHTMSGDLDNSVPGANCCLTKPLDTDELLNRMERCLAAM
jgi:CheY-like chemotaxis protein